MSSWKAHWDDMVLNQHTPLQPEHICDIFFKKIRGSEVLKSYGEHFDRLANDHPNKTYK